MHWKILYDTTPDKRNRARVVCECVCGTIKTVNRNSIRLGLSTNCGCLRKGRAKNMGLANITHGKTDTKEYRAWHGLKSRTLSPTNKNAEHYSLRGISVSKEWEKSFEKFFEDMGPAPSLQHSIDRIDNNKGYCKENCRWATTKEQARNTRRSIFVEFQGQRKNLAEWAEIHGINYKTLWRRFNRGWKPERLFTGAVCTKV